MSNYLDFISEDWKKIPQNIRYIFLFGFFLIFNSWLLDHWGHEIPYKLIGKFDLREFGYNLGFILIIFGFLIISIKQFIIYKNIIIYRKKYPIEKLDTDYYLFWYDHKLWLIDTKSKTYYHVHPWETAQNLLFTSYGYKINEDFRKVDELKYNDGSIPIIINMKKYKYGGQINTQI
jgi:hypothetical protein